MVTATSVDACSLLSDPAVVCVDGSTVAPAHPTAAESCVDQARDRSGAGIPIPWSVRSGPTESLLSPPLHTSTTRNPHS